MLKNKLVIQWGLIILLIGYHLVRMIIFINQYGGIEHDSGWFLGVARSLAEQGSYTTMVSTIADPTVGGQDNIYGQFNIQDETGRIYFFTESGVYGAGILPNALVIKLFGAGFWQYRAAPLLFLCLGLLLLSYFILQLAGVSGVILFHAYLFFYPHLTIFLGYEAMGEVFSLTYLLLTYLLFLLALNNPRWFFWVGFGAGVALMTKPITLLSLGGLVLAAMLAYLHKQMSLKQGVWMVVGLLIPPILWELSQMVTLTMLFDWPSYQNHLLERFDFFANEGGSGLGTSGRTDWAFYLHKIEIVSHISADTSWVSRIVFGLLLVSGGVLLWQFKQPQPRSIISFFWGGWVVHTVWFVSLSKTGWVRHDWYALIWAICLLSLLFGYLVQQSLATQRPHYIALTGLFMVLWLIGVAQQPTLNNWLISPQLVEHWRAAQINTDWTRVPWGLVSRQDQQDVADYLSVLPKDSHVYYPQGHKSAEMAVLSGRMLYPLERRPLMPQHSQDVILVGPSLISPWAKLMDKALDLSEQQGLIDSVRAQIKNECEKVLLENDYYLVCGF